MINERILTEYNQVATNLRRAEVFLSDHLKEVLRTHHVKIQMVASRVKEEASLAGKIARPDKTYHTLWDVTDLVGLRVITYFEDTVEQVARIIEQSFKIDLSRSSNRLHHRDLGHFGYRSLHYICALSNEQSRECELPPEFRIEIQVRTVLQHAWAEIEHDLGYKAADTIPAELRHRFSRVAGLLEIADQEFGSIRNDIARYEDSLPQIRDPENLNYPIDRLSLASVVDSSSVAEIDSHIAKLLNKEIVEERFYPEYLLKMLKLSGLNSAAEVSNALKRERERIPHVVSPYFTFAEGVWRLGSESLSEIRRGYSLFFLAHIVLLEAESLELNKVGRLVKFYHELDYPDDKRSAERVAVQLYEALALGLKT